MPCPPRMHADGLRVRRLDRGDVQAELEAGAPPRHPHHPVAEALLGQLLPVGRGGQRDPGVRVQVVHVRGVDQPVHRGVDRRRGAALAVQAVVERGDHLVLAVDPGVDVDQAAQPVQPQHRQVLLGQRAQVAAGALHPEQLDRLPGDRVGLGALGGGVPAGVVGVARVGAQPVRAGDQVADGRCSSVIEVPRGVVGTCEVSSGDRRRVRRPSRPGCRRPARRRSAAGSRRRRRRPSGPGAGRGPRGGRPAAPRTSVS